jgi:ankyrin repeat protein
MNCCSNNLSSEEIDQLMRAAATGNQAYVQSCLSSSEVKTVNAKDRFGQTAAHWSAYRGQIHILKLLIEAGASMSVKDMDGRTTLHWAVRKERASCVQYLLQQGSPLDGQTKGTGETSLHKAARQGNFDICKLLCIAGAKRNVSTTHNQTALDIAKEMRQLEVEYAEKERRKIAEEKKEENKDDTVAVAVDEEAEKEELTDAQKSQIKSYPTDRPKESSSPYVADGIEMEEENKFGPIVELLEFFTDDMINLESLKEEEETKKQAGGRGGRGKRKLKRKSTIYQDDTPMAEVFEEQLRSGSMQSGGKTGGCVLM